MNPKQIFGGAILLLLITGGRPYAFSQAGNNEEMTKIFTADQKERENPMKLTPSDWQVINAHDAERRKQVRKLLDAGAITTGDDFEHAAFIFQHGNLPEDYLLAHILAVAAVARGDLKARWISAATLDRYLEAVKQPQVFGTQYSWKITPKDATQEPYDHDLVSDALRREFCVSKRADQAENLQDVADSKDPRHPDGCR
jgi:hypothetical protein